MKLAKRLRNIEPFHVMDLLARAKSMESDGVDVIHLEVGEPDFSSPKGVIEAGINALQQGLTHYTAATGLPELKQLLADFYWQRYGKKSKSAANYYYPRGLWCPATHCLLVG